MFSTLFNYRTLNRFGNVFCVAASAIIVTTLARPIEPYDPVAAHIQLAVLRSVGQPTKLRAAVSETHREGQIASAPMASSPDLLMRVTRLEKQLSELAHALRQLKDDLGSSTGRRDAKGLDEEDESTTEPNIEADVTTTLA